MRNARIVDEDVHALGFQNRSEQFFDLFLIGDVAGGSRGLSSVGGHLQGHGLGCFPIDVEDVYRSSAVREAMDNGAADAASSARDNGEFAVKTKGICS